MIGVYYAILAVGLAVQILTGEDIITYSIIMYYSVILKQLQN